MEIVAYIVVGGILLYVGGRILTLAVLTTLAKFNYTPTTKKRGTDEEEGV